MLVLIYYIILSFSLVCIHTYSRSQVENNPGTVGRHIDTQVGKAFREIRPDRVRGQLGWRLLGVQPVGQPKGIIFDILLNTATIHYCCDIQESILTIHNHNLFYSYKLYHFFSWFFINFISSINFIVANPITADVNYFTYHLVYAFV